MHAFKGHCTYLRKICESSVILRKPGVCQGCAFEGRFWKQLQDHSCLSNLNASVSLSHLSLCAPSLLLSHCFSKTTYHTGSVNRISQSTVISGFIIWPISLTSWRGEQLDPQRQLFFTLVNVTLWGRRDPNLSLATGLRSSIEIYQSFFSSVIHEIIGVEVKICSWARGKKLQVIFNERDFSSRRTQMLLIGARPSDTNQMPSSDT